jgi:hypothetical protein
MVHAALLILTAAAAAPFDINHRIERIVGSLLPETVLRNDQGGRQTTADRASTPGTTSPSTGH